MKGKQQLSLRKRMKEYMDIQKKEHPLKKGTPTVHNSAYRIVTKDF